MFKRIFILCFLSLFLSTTSSAGIISKGVKTAAAVKAAQFISKKIVKNNNKDSTKPLLKKELDVGIYKDQRLNPEKGLDYHHIPSAKQIEKFGIKRNDGVSIGVQSDRHSLTRTYGNGNKKILKENETIRDSLARDIKDLKQIYKDNGLYNKDTRNALKKVIEKNKEKFNEKYKKENNL